MTKHAKFYVGGPDRKDFKTLKDARAFFEANPEYGVLGRWVEWVRGSHKGEIIDDRRKGMKFTEATQRANDAMGRAMARKPSPVEMRVLEGWQRGIVTDAELERVFGPHIWKTA